MAGASKKREARRKAEAPSSHSGERRPTPPNAVSVPGLSPSSSVVSPFVPASPYRSTMPVPGRGVTPASGSHSSASTRSLGARFDGNTSRAGSPAPASRSSSPGPAARGRSVVDARNLDLGAAAWASINQLGSSNLPTRPAALNQQGQEVSIALNSYKVSSYPTHTVYQYDVLVLPHGETKSDPEGVRRVVLNKIWKSRAVQESLGGPGFIYDGNKLAWCMRKVDQIRVIVDLDKEREPDRESRGRNQFKVQLRPSTEVNFTTLDAYLAGKGAWNDQCLEAIAFLDHLLRETPRNKFFSFRRSFFSRDNQRMSLGGGVEAFKGVYASMRCAYHGPTLPRSLSVNVDVANGTFWIAGSLLQAMMAACGITDKSMFQRQFQAAAGEHWRKTQLHDNLKRLSRVKVWSQHRGVRDDYTIDKILPVTATEHKFSKEDGSKVTLQQYFRQTYRIDSEVGLPVVQMMRKVGPPGRKSNIVMPVNLLNLAENQRYAYKLSDNQTSAMIKFAVTLPSERMKGIESGVKSLSWATDPYLTKYGVKIDGNRTVVKGRLLPAPDVVFANGSIAASQAGQGRWRIDGKKFATSNPQLLKSWGVCVVQDRFAPDKEATTRFFKQFVHVARGHGITIADGPPVIIPGNTQQGGEMITNLWNTTGNNSKMRPQLLFFVLPRKDRILYQSIKKSCDVRYGVVSQCLQAAHVQKCQDQYISNVCLKVNAKLGGSTSRAGSKLMPRLNPKFNSIPTMVIGADVSHAAPGIDDQGSMAAITMSSNRELTRFAAHVQTNGRRVEMIMEKVWDEMEPMLGWWVKNVGGGQLPQRLIYLRDGISEGQYQQCLDTEVGYLRNLLKKVHPGNTTKITVVICSKRHHIRFFPTDTMSGDRNGNPKPGTLIETGVTHPFENDFYLCSHAAIKGTARPVHYHVIKNECEISSAELQQMLYDSSYSYARATTPVSLPPAVYYAHLASNRAIAHINQPAHSSGPKDEGTKRPSAMSSTSNSSLPEIAPLMSMNNQGNIKASMWYI